MKGRCSAMAALTIILTTMWLLPVVQPRSAEAAVATFSGEGDGSTGFFFLNMGPVTVTYTHGGTSNFNVHGEHTSGQETLFLANDIGDVLGSGADRVPVAGSYLVTINADAPWTITVHQPPDECAGGAADLARIIHRLQERMREVRTRRSQ